MEGNLLKRSLAVVAIGLILLLGLLPLGCSRDTKTVPDAKVQDQPKSSEQVPKAPPEKKSPQKVSNYFPLTRGSTWEYQGEGNEFASFTREVLFVKDNRGQIRESNGGTVSATIFEVTDSAVTRVFNLPETYEKVNLLDRPSNEKVVILKSPLEVGNSWKDPNGERQIVDLNATVTTPSGKVENCVKVKIAGQHSVVYEYFKEGVGMVMREFISGEARVASALKRFEIK